MIPDPPIRDDTERELSDRDRVICEVILGNLSVEKAEKLAAEKKWVFTIMPKEVEAAAAYDALHWSPEFLAGWLAHNDPSSAARAEALLRTWGNHGQHPAVTEAVCDVWNAVSRGELPMTGRRPDFKGGDPSLREIIPPLQLADLEWDVGASALVPARVGFAQPTWTSLRVQREDGLRRWPKRDIAAETAEQGKEKKGVLETLVEKLKAVPPDEFRNYTIASIQEQFGASHGTTQRALKKLRP